MNIEDMMDYLIKNRVDSLPAKEFSDIFENLCWCLADNGKEIQRVRRSWLFECDDHFKVDIALKMDGSFPVDSRVELESCLENISNKWPEFAQYKTHYLAAWDKQFPL